MIYKKHGTVYDIQRQLLSTMPLLKENLDNNIIFIVLGSIINQLIRRKRSTAMSLKIQSRLLHIN